MKLVRNPYSQTLVIVAGLVVGLGAPRTLRSQEKSAQPTSGIVYEVDTKVSRVYVKVLPDGRGHAHGVMGRFASGRGLLGARDKIGELVIDLASFAADDPEARKYVRAGRERLRT